MPPHFTDVSSAPLGWAFFRFREARPGLGCFEWWNARTGTWGDFAPGLVTACQQAAFEGPLKGLQGAVTTDPPVPCWVAYFVLDPAGKPLSLVRTEWTGARSPSFAPAE
jgi:hypothetical protein